MSTVPSVARDERTIAVENASFRWAYLSMSFGLLLVVSYRSLLWRESPWDLMAIVILGGGIAYAYQGFRSVLSRRWIAATLLSVLLAVVAALLAVFLLR